MYAPKISVSGILGASANSSPPNPQPMSATSTCLVIPGTLRAAVATPASASFSSACCFSSWAIAVLCSAFSGLAKTRQPTVMSLSNACLEHSKLFNPSLIAPLHALQCLPIFSITFLHDLSCAPPNSSSTLVSASQSNPSLPFLHSPST